METLGPVEVNLEAERDRLAGIFCKYYPSVEEHPELYHNFGHPLEVVSDMIADISYCEQNGITFTSNEKLMLLCESFMHDLGINWPLNHLSQYSSPEDRSRQLGRPILVHFGYDREEVAEPAGEITMATQLGSVCKVDDERMSLLRKMARRTDMGNVAKDYDFFIDKVVANWHEFIYFHPDQANITLKDFWFTKARPVVVELVYNEDLSYGDWDRGSNDVCPFQKRCAENIDAFDQELMTA